jgi:Carboxypeptidase regulatory-like domain
MRNYLYAGAAIAALVAPVAAYAQETTSSIRGVVQSGGVPVAGATVTITHEPSGTVSSVTTGNDGGFSASGLRIGGPFTVKVEASGYGDSSVSEISLTAGQPLRLPIELVSQAADIVVTASSSAARVVSTGPITSLDRQAIEGVASVSRDIRDLTRRDPFVTIDQSNRRAIEVAGQNGRLNRFSVDGVRFSDNFGLNNGGLPTARGPVSLDAIEQLSVKIAPADISEGDFQGGAINVVLRSGGNKFKGSAFYTYSDDSITGDRSKNTRVDLDFKSKNYGGFLSGPIIKDKLFFALSYERLDENQPPQFGLAGAPSPIPNLTQAQVDNVTSLAQSLLNFDTLGVYRDVKETDEKVSAKVDFNLTDTQRLSGTYIYNRGTVGNEQNGSVSTTSPGLGLLSNAYLLEEVVNSGVIALNSDWSDNFSSEIRLNYRKTDRAQDPFGGRSIGQVTVCTDLVNPADNPATATIREDNPNQCRQGNAANPGSARVVFGPDVSRQANALSTESYGGDITLRYTAGDHSIKVLLGYNRFKVDNLFLQNALGTFFFDSIADFQARRAGSLVLAGSVSGNLDDVKALYSYDTLLFGIQDSWDITDKLNFTYGVRTEIYSQGSRPALNTNFLARYGFSNTKNFNGLTSIQPRIGFTYEATDRLKIRGGAGLFGGGTPDVLLSNSFSNTGVFANQVTIQRNISNAGVVTCSVQPATLCDQALNNVNGRTFDPAVTSFVRTNTGALALANVNALDPDYKLASQWKVSLSADYEADLGPLGDGWNFGGDFLFSAANNVTDYTDLRSVQIGTAADGRPRYGPLGGVATANQDLILTNSKKGRGIILVGRAAKSWDFGLSANISYTFQDIRDVNPSNSATANSNYNQQAVLDPNRGVLGTSIYQIRNSVKFGLDYEKAFFGDFKTRFSLFGEKRSGRPYSLTFADNASTLSTGRGNVFGVLGQNNRFLLYVPNVSSITADSLVSYDSQATFDAFKNFVERNKLKQGAVIKKNSERSPSFFKVDLHVDQEIPTFIGKSRIKLFADMENVLNFIDKDWGSLRQVAFPQLAPVVNVACATALVNNSCGRYLFSNFQNPQIINQTRISLWSLRVGAKVEF